MDNVKLGFDEPQEDEYALVKMGIRSPLEKLVFPVDDNFFLTGTQSLIPEEKNLSQWIDNFRIFYKKLVFQTGKRVVFKNPFHSLRIDLLKEIFPNAFFIYIYRNPYVVIPSTRRMWSIVGKQNCLKKYRSEPSMEAITKVYKTCSDSIHAALQQLPENRYFNVKFEDLEKDPLQTLNILYKHMGTGLDSSHEQAVKSFLSENADFRKNRYTLTADEVSLIQKELKEELERTGYANPY
jgi:hypothetical protein